MMNIENNIDDIQAFAELKAKFYQHNFGCATKSDIELMMFKFYLEAAKKYATDENTGIVNESMISDYKIGAQLGLSPARVRNLKLKIDLQYSDDYEWKNELANVLLNAKNIRSDGDYVELVIRKQHLFNAIRDWVEDQGDSIEITLNTNQLRMRKFQFFSILSLVLDEQDQEKLKRSIVEAIPNGQYQKDDPLDKILKIAQTCESASAAIVNIVSLFNPVGHVAREIIQTVKTIL